MIGRGDKYCIDIIPFQQASVVRKALAFADLLGAIDPPLIDVAHGGDLDVLGFAFLRKAADMPRSHPADPDDSNANAVARADRAQSSRRAEHGSASGEGGTLQESAA